MEQNRENLFRGKRKDNGEWVEGFYFCMVHDDGSHVHHFIMPLGVDLSLGTPIEKIQVEVIPETVCRYTGLPDKNGRKIFEGHIVRYSEIGAFGKVVWYEDDYIGFAVDDINDSFQQYDKDLFGKVEVIGNIFDNPELLEGVQND